MIYLSVAGKHRKRFLTFSLTQLRENFMMNLGQEKNRLVYLMGEEEEFANRFNSFISTKNIHSLEKEFSKAYEHISANGNAKIIFLDLALQMVKIIR